MLQISTNLVDRSILVILEMPVAPRQRIGHVQHGATGAVVLREAEAPMVRSSDVWMTTTAGIRHGE